MPLKEFELATGNLVIGRFIWLIVYVPEGWAVKIGDTPADVNYTTVVDNVGWVLDGSTSYFAVNLVTGDVYDLEIKVRKGVKPFNQFTENIEVTSVNGHRAYIYTREVKRGFRRSLMKQMVVTIPCAKTSRTIEITVTGKDAPPELRTALNETRCH